MRVFSAHIFFMQAEIEMIAHINDRLVHDCTACSNKGHRRVFHTIRVRRGERWIRGRKRRAVAVATEIHPPAIIAAEAGSVRVNRDEIRNRGHGSNSNMSANCVPRVLRSTPTGSRPGHQRGKGIQQWGLSEEVSNVLAVKTSPPRKTQ